MQRTALWIIGASLAAILIIGGVVVFLRSRDVGGLATYVPLGVGGQKQTEGDKNLYDPPSNYLPKDKQPNAPAPTMPEAAQPNGFQSPLMQLPSTLTP